MSNSPEPSEPANRCRTCGAVLNGSRLDGLCPACTWRGLSEIEPEEELEIAAAESKIKNQLQQATNGGPKSKIEPEGLFKIPGYVVSQEIARGGMGIVYRARQIDPEREVAVKMLLPHQFGSSEMRERFRLEARAIAGLEHPAILPVYQVGQTDGLPYFTMKLALGGTLAQRRDQFAGDWRAIAQLMITLADAVQ